MQLTTRFLAIAAASLALATLTTRAFADPIPGTVDEATRTTIKVSGHTYKIEDTTTFEDQSGSRVALTELQPGTPVEIELSDDHLVNVKATVVR